MRCLVPSTVAVTDITETTTRTTSRGTGILLLVVLSFLSVSHIHQVRAEQERRQPSVLVLGAGISGAAAAKVLAENEDLQVTILESNNRVGGRILTVTSGDAVFDLGGMNWHGATPAFQRLQREWNLSVIESAGNSSHPGAENAEWFLYHAFDKVVVPMPPAQVNHTYNVFNKWYNEMMERYTNCTELDNDHLVLAEWSLDILRKLTKIRRGFAEFHIHMRYNLDSGLSIEEHQLRGFGTNWEWKEVDPRGKDWIAADGMQHWIEVVFKKILQSNHPRVSLHLDSHVSQIKYSKEKCSVTTEDGRDFEADRCITTFSLGVLKNSTRLFSPRLPPEKLDALDRNGMGLLNTIAVLFDQDICNSNATAYYLVGAKKIGNPLNTGFVCIGNLRNADPKSIQFYVGPEAKTENWDDEDYWRQHVVNIVKKFKNDITEDNIKSIHWSRWHKERSFQGSYSAPVRKTRGNTDRRILAESVDSVYFAGEHTDYHGRYQSMDGAYDSGERAATEVLQSLYVTTNIEKDEL